MITKEIFTKMVNWLRANRAEPVDGEYQFRVYPYLSSELTINENITIESLNSSPNWWWRMWQYLLLGWKWHDVKEKQDEQ